MLVAFFNFREFQGASPPGVPPARGAPGVPPPVPQDQPSPAGGQNVYANL